MTHTGRNLQPPHMWYEFGPTILKHPMGGQEHVCAHTGVFLHENAHVVFTVQLTLQQVHSFLPSEFSRQCNLGLPPSNSSIFSFPKGQPVAPYVFSSSLPIHPFFNNVLEGSSCAKCDQSN